MTMALSNAERQRRYRARRKGALPPPPARSPGPPSRAKRWRTAVATLLELQEGYRERLHKLPGSLHDSPCMKLQAVDDLDPGELEAIDPPLGYDKD